MTILYGIKNCDTVKKARKWLEANDIDHTFHDFRVDGITETMVKDWLKTQPLETLVNKRSTTWKQLDDTTKASLTSSNAPALCAKFETLIKRPVLEFNNDIHLGFNEKNYSQLFEIS